MQEVDQHTDVQKQIQHDPSGALAVFWAEQRRMLDKKTHKQKQWNPEVHNYYLFIYFYACNNYYLLFITYYLFNNYFHHSKYYEYTVLSINVYCI